MCIYNVMNNNYKFNFKFLKIFLNKSFLKYNIIKTLFHLYI